MDVIEERARDRSLLWLKAVSFALHVIAVVGGIWFGVASFHWIAGG